MSWETIASKQLNEPTRMSTCPIPCPESSPTPSHMPKPNASKIIVFKTKNFLFSKTYYRDSVNILDYPPKKIAGKRPKTFMVLIQSDLLDDSPSQFFRKSSFEIPFTKIFPFYFLSCHALTPDILGYPSAYGMHYAIRNN